MRAREKILIVSLLLLVGTLCWFSWSHMENVAPTPEPSHWGGYYDEAFTLRLSAPKNGTIYYTTDGSLPTADSQKYVDGIPIRNRSGEPNRYASQQRVVTSWSSYTPDPTPVEKGTVVRAVFVSRLGFSSEVLTQTYFVGIQPPERGYTLSIVFENDDLFGEDGICVTGKEYDSWYTSGGGEEEKPEPNFMKKLEVPVIAEILDTQGDILNQTLGLRVQGYSSRYEPQKRFALTARSKYSGTDVLDAMLYDGITTHSVMLKDRLTDAMIQDLFSDRAVSTQGCIPVQVYLNGEFLYSSFLLERYDTHYFRQHYGISNRILVKNGFPDQEPSVYSETDYYEYEYFLNWINETDFSGPEQWEQFCEKADAQSFIDYMCINYYLCNVDFSDWWNQVLWRSPVLGQEPYGDMRWRWCIYDIDALMWYFGDPYPGGAEEISIFSIASQLDPRTEPPLFSTHNALKSNPEYCRRFVLSFMDICNNNLSTENTDAMLAKYGYTPDWGDGYFRKRPDYAPGHLAEEFGLTGSLETVSVICAHPEMGEVMVNTSQIDLSDGSWTGKYFTDYPITVTAVPKEGYRFLGWKGDADQAESVLTCAVDGGITLEAVFAEEK